MLASVEVRWFIRGTLPEAARVWLDALGGHPEKEQRTDRYVPTAAEDLGVKVREAKVEVKRRTATLDPGRWSGAAGCVEAWEKWSLDLASGTRPNEWIAVEKKRWQVHFRVRGERVQLVPQLGPRTAGANVELSHVVLDGVPWWSVCLEAYGPDDAARRDALDRVAALVFRQTPPGLTDAASIGYPAWLAREAAR